MYERPNVSYLQVENGVCVYIGICAYEGEPKPGSAAGMTPIHLMGPCRQAHILNTYSNRAYSKATGSMLNKEHFLF